MARPSRFTPSFKAKVALEAWEELLEGNGIRIGMDGRGRCKDNIRIERFWRTLKQEHVFLHPTDSVAELHKGIGDFIEFYNYERPTRA